MRTISGLDDKVYEVVKLSDLKEGERFIMAEDVENGWEDRVNYEVCAKHTLTAFCRSSNGLHQHYNNHHNVCKI